MSIRYRNGRPVVEVYDERTGTKRHVSPKDYGMSFKGLSGRALERAARTLETRAMEAGVLRTDTCDSFAKRWPDDYPGKRGESTREHNRERVAQFGKDFAKRSLRSVSRSEARTWATEHRSRLAAVRAMFNDALEDGLVDSNPFAKLGFEQSKGRQGKVTIPTHEEVDRLSEISVELYGEWGVEFGAMIVWAAYTCMRPGEIYSATYSRLDGDTYDVDGQYHSKLAKETGTKHGGKGLIYVPRQAREAVLHKPRRLGDDLMFRTKRGKRFTQTNLYNVWNPVRCAFGRPDMDFYELRHTGAAHMLNNLEMEPWVIAEQLRHSDGGKLVTTLYGQPSRRKALEIIRRGFELPEAGTG